MTNEEKIIKSFGLHWYKLTTHDGFVHYAIKLPTGEYYAFQFDRSGQIQDSGTFPADWEEFGKTHGLNNRVELL